MVLFFWETAAKMMIVLQMHADTPCVMTLLQVTCECGVTLVPCNMPCRLGRDRALTQHNHTVVQHLGPHCLPPQAPVCYTLCGIVLLCESVPMPPRHQQAAMEGFDQQSRTHSRQSDRQAVR